jgi:hypothetical protein
MLPRLINYGYIADIYIENMIAYESFTIVFGVNDNRFRL